MREKMQISGNFPKWYENHAVPVPSKKNNS